MQQNRDFASPYHITITLISIEVKVSHVPFLIISNFLRKSTTDKLLKSSLDICDQSNLPNDVVHVPPFLTNLQSDYTTWRIEMSFTLTEPSSPSPGNVDVIFCLDFCALMYALWWSLQKNTLLYYCSISFCILLSTFGVDALFTVALILQTFIERIGKLES